MGTWDAGVARWDSRSENVVLSLAGSQEGLCAGSRLRGGPKSRDKEE